MKHLITAIVENRPGVLARIVGLISGRGFNIETLNVAPTDDSTQSRITMSVPGDDHVLQQVTKQLNKMIDVIKVTDITQRRHLNRELTLVEVSVPPEKRIELVELARVFDAKIVSIQPRSVTIQMAEEKNRIEDFLKIIRPMGILDLARTGVIAVSKGE